MSDKIKYALHIYTSPSTAEAILYDKNFKEVSRVTQAFYEHLYEIIDHDLEYDYISVNGYITSYEDMERDYYLHIES